MRTPALDQAMLHVAVSPAAAATVPTAQLHDWLEAKTEAPIDRAERCTSNNRTQSVRWRPYKTGAEMAVALRRFGDRYLHGQRWRWRAMRCDALSVP